MRRRWLGVVVVLALGPRLARAQRPPAVPATGSVSGSVLSAETGQPLAGAIVVLEAAPDAAVVTAAGGSFFGRSLTVSTDAAGQYRFANVPPGGYRLLVRHLGHRPARLEVSLVRAEPFRVSVGLVVQPILLEAMDVGSAALEPYGRTRTAAEESRIGRLEAERFRAASLLEGDARVLTHGEVLEAVTLGEPDLLRALQRLPGVSTRDDFNASLWVRGAPWSHARVTFDGLPLFNPVHAIGLLSGIGPDAIGLASFHPGVRPAAMAEGAAGVLNIESRAAGAPGWRGLAELSVASARAATDVRSGSGRVGLALSARRSHVDLFSRLLESLGGDSTTYIPYAFYDVAGRFDAALGTRTAIEASGMWERDALRGSVPDLIRDSRGGWGNLVGRLTLSHAVGALQARHSVGGSRFSGTIEPENFNEADPAPAHAPLDNSVRVISAGSELAPLGVGPRPSWSMGWQISEQRQAYKGPYPRPYPSAVLFDTLRLRERLSVLAVWGERRFDLTRALALSAGVRVEKPDPARNLPGLAVAPRVAARYTALRGLLTVSAGVGRTYQYTQAIAPSGPSVGPDLFLTDVWLLANDTIPAMRADVATGGVEAALGDWIVSTTVWGRRTTGVAVPEPSPAQVLTSARPILVVAESRAHGLELSARRLVGRWTGSAAYTFSRSDLESTSGLAPITYRYPSSADRRHVLDATVLARVTGGLRAGAAFTAASGAPYSRFFLGSAACDSTAGPCPPPDTFAVAIELPNANRTAPYASLDLLFDWSHTTARGLTIGAWLQLRNVTGRANAVTYTGSFDTCPAPHPPTLVEYAPDNCDRFNRGIGRLPLVGVRVSF